MSLVSFKASGSKGWLEQGLRLPSTWWLSNHASLPILQEILELIRKQKPRTGGQSRLPRNQKSLIAFKVRGKVLWFQNDSRCVILGVLDGDEGLAAFRWFLEELSKDSKDVGGPAAAGDAGEPAESEPSDRGPDEFGIIVSGALQILHSNERCLQATYLPSRVSIRVAQGGPGGVGVQGEEPEGEACRGCGAWQPGACEEAVRLGGVGSPQVPGFG